MAPFAKPLSKKDETLYINMLKNGTPDESKLAQDVLIKHNMRLVASVANKYTNWNDDIDDLISIGTIGLIKAIQTYDVDKGRLATYAFRCIENELNMYMRKRTKIIYREVHLLDPIGHDKEGKMYTRMDTLVDESSISMEDNLYMKDRISDLYSLLGNVLNERERIIICMTYGLCGYEEQGQKEMGELLGISRSYVSRILARSLVKLRRYMEDDKVWQTKH